MPAPIWLKRIFSLGLEVEPRTDIIALAAFFLALSGVLFQTVAYFRGPEIQLFAPDQVALYAQAYPDKQQYMTLITSLAYVNTGQPGYNGTLRREAVRLRLGERDYEWVWHRFVSTDAKGVELQVVDKGEARPLPVAAGSSESHETEFRPRRQRCQPEQSDCDTNANFLTLEQLLAAMERQGQLRFTFSTEVYGEQPVTVTCAVDVDAGLRLALRENGWAASSCWEVK